MQGYMHGRLLQLSLRVHGEMSLVRKLRGQGRSLGGQERSRVRTIYVVWVPTLLPRPPLLLLLYYLLPMSCLRVMYPCHSPGIS